MFYAILISGLIAATAIVVQIILGRGGPSNKKSHINFFWIVVLTLAFIHIVLGVSFYGN